MANKKYFWALVNERGLIFISMPDFNIKIGCVFGTRNEANKVFKKCNNLGNVKIIKVLIGEINKYEKNN
jgi:hypothetical protein